VTGFTNGEENAMDKYEMVSKPKGPGSCEDAMKAVGGAHASPVRVLWFHFTLCTHPHSTLALASSPPYPAVSSYFLYYSPPSPPHPPITNLSCPLCTPVTFRQVQGWRRV
jgi:hypothetical protein